MVGNSSGSALKGATSVTYDYCGMYYPYVLRLAALRSIAQCDSEPVADSELANFLSSSLANGLVTIY